MSEELDAAYEAAAAAIGRADALLVTTHESPDGDAIGSLLAAELALSRAGHDVVTFIGGTGRFPRELRWLGTDAIARVAPEDAARRTLLALDCGSARRIGDGEALLRRVAGSVNVDHHHDNTRFADVDVVDPSAACTTMMLARLLDALGRPLEADVATRLYVGLVTDTGRFAYANTDAAALRLAARLVETGARPATVFRELYEKTPLAKGRLLARGLERVESLLDGRLLLTSLTRADFAETGAEDADSDGIVDHLRAVEGVAAAALIREPPAVSGPAWKVSLRSSSPAVDVSRVARAGGGGGHVQAAGFSSDLPFDELRAFIARELDARGR